MDSEASLDAAALAKRLEEEAGDPEFISGLATPPPDEDKEEEEELVTADEYPEPTPPISAKTTKWQISAPITPTETVLPPILVRT